MTTLLGSKPIESIPVPYAGKAKDDSKAGGIVSFINLPAGASGLVFFNLTMNNDEKGFFAPRILIAPAIAILKTLPGDMLFKGSKPDGFVQWVLPPGGANVSGKDHHYSPGTLCQPFSVSGPATIVGLVRGNVRPGFLTGSGGSKIGIENVTFRVETV